MTAAATATPTATTRMTSLPRVRARGPPIAAVCTTRLLTLGLCVLTLAHAGKSAGAGAAANSDSDDDGDEQPVIIGGGSDSEWEGSDDSASSR